MDHGWLSTLRKDGSPRLARVWFVEHNGAVWMASGHTTLKVADILRDKRVGFAREGQHEAMRGVAAIVSIDSEPEVQDLFKAGYEGWDVADPAIDGTRVLIRAHPWSDPTR
ncbi:pyridoxamine 5'-phosphate oxidase family protein [Marisediminicola sp. LYQ134]|uniref:pyridoxamine 5'-phosphate oxidase family protein n=1 Tax=Marisediminicola sp. LYQ134 TaxID=3391061 RepID=UPI003983284D